MTAMVAVAAKAVAMAFLYCMYIYVYVYNTCSASHLMFTSKALKMIRPSNEFKMNVTVVVDSENREFACSCPSSSRHIVTALCFFPFFPSISRFKENRSTKPWS